MNRVFPLIALGGYLLFAQAAHAVEWGARASTLISDISPGGGQRNPTSVICGGKGAAFADAELDDSVLPDFDGDGPHDRGRAHAFAGLVFAANAPPALKAEGFLTGKTSGKPHLGQFPNGAVIDANAFASDLFQYTGAAPTVLTLTFALEGIVSDQPADPTQRTGLSAEVAVLADTPNYQFHSSLSTLVSELGATLKDTERVSIMGDTGGASASAQASLSFPVNPGETFYVWESLTISAVRGTRFADAFSSLTSTFSEPQNVRSLSAPEPSGLWLALGGLAVAVHGRPRRSMAVG